MSSNTKYIMGTARPTWKAGEAQTITFAVTEECNLRCKYCYMVGKNGKKKMTFEIAKKAIDYFFENAELFTSNSVIIEFIGGEPLLEIELIDKICDYFKLASYEKRHKWFDSYRFSFSTNGLLYSDKKFQKYLRKNKDKVSVGITIDGNKEKHDLQRVYEDGSGSYDNVVKEIALWKKQYPTASTKVTISRDDLPFIKDSIVHLWNLGLEDVPANVVFENVWQVGDDVIFENQLKELADYIIDNELWNKYNTSLFSDSIGYPYSEDELKNNFCGSGKMIAIDVEGNLFPCVRYMDYSLQDKPGYLIGNVNEGINFDKVRPFLALDVKTQSSEECIECEIATGCAWCQAYNYDSSKINTNYQRSTAICNMHKARVRGNNYYWSKLQETTNVQKEVNKNINKYLYIILSDDSVSHCDYKTYNNSDIYMSEDMLEKALRFAAQNFYQPVLLHSKNTPSFSLHSKYLLKGGLLNITSSTFITEKSLNDKIIVIDDYIGNFENISGDICVLNFKEKDIDRLALIVKKLLKCFNRINLNIDYSYKAFKAEAYKDQLYLINIELVGYFKKNQKKEVSVLTDRLFLEKMDNCNAGDKNVALGPNGKLYVCPAFYFEQKGNFIGSIEEGIKFEMLQIFKLNNAPICRKCDAYHCKRCMFKNKKYSSEYNTPSLDQCKISHVEREASLDLINLMRQSYVSFFDVKEIPIIDYSDPLEVISREGSAIPFKLDFC